MGALAPPPGPITLPEVLPRPGLPWGGAGGGDPCSEPVLEHFSLVTPSPVLWLSPPHPSCRSYFLWGRKTNSFNIPHSFRNHCLGCKLWAARVPAVYNFGSLISQSHGLCHKLQKSVSRPKAEHWLVSISTFQSAPEEISLRLVG